MHIVVLLKQVHDPNIPRTSLRVSADQHTLALPPGSNPILNGYDANALEESLKLRDRRGGSVTAVSLGSDSTKDVLRRAIAMGADKALHVAGTGGLEGDSSLTARLLTAAIRSLGPVELVLAGRSASDSDAGVVPALVAGQLGYSLVTPVRALGVDEGGALIADRLAEGCVRRLRIAGPAVIGVSNEINKPRSPSLKGVVASKRATIPTLTAADLGVAPCEPALRLCRLSIPAPPAVIAELITGTTADELGRRLADRLREEGLI